MTFADAYLSGLFSNLVCPCGATYTPDDLEKAKEHWDLGHYQFSQRKGVKKEIPQSK